MTSETAHPLHSEAAIHNAVDRMATAIRQDLGDEFQVVCILTGAFLFTADLVRALSRLGARPHVDFVALKSYGKGTESKGNVQLVGDVPDNLEGRPVLLVDDILDTGRTLERARELIAERGAGAIKSAVLLDKPARRTQAVSADYVGFTIEDVFVVGYGIDYAERWRHLPYLAYVDPRKSPAPRTT